MKKQSNLTDKKSLKFQTLIGKNKRKAESGKEFVKTKKSFFQHLGAKLTKAKSCFLEKELCSLNF